MIRVVILCGMVAAFPVATGAATLREARVRVVFSTGACDVAGSFVVDTPEPELVEHRVMLGGGRIPELAVIGAFAHQAGTVGRTLRLPVALTGSGRNEYRVQYRSAFSTPANRCPLVVPAAATDGFTRSVRIDVVVPDGATRLPGEFPAFAWHGREGSIAIGHVPSFVRVPYVIEGAAYGWRDTLDFRRLVDIAALIVIASTSLVWLAFQRRRA